jgi:L-lactate dehydrogenase complex protein LldF
MSVIDQAANAARFIQDRTHEAHFDELLWMIRQKRDQAASQVPEWEELRDLASAIKEYTLSNLAHYLEMFEASANRNGAIVHWARDAHEHTRALILQAKAGMTGGNFAIAETGAIVTVTNEGNADLSGNTPKRRIHSVGIEKIIPKDEHLAVFIRLLTRSATGMPITQYTSHFRGPREGGEMHIVIVDNGRSTRLGMEKFWPSLKCIRCAACMNTCPVFRRSGGLSYGSTYMGPIGLITMPTFDIRRYGELPFSSTLNGSCSNVCPVKINIHEQIYAWRSVMDEQHQIKFPKKEAMIVAGKVLSHPETYRIATEASETALKELPRFAIYNRLNPWGYHRDVPAPAKETFHQWYKKNRLGNGSA